MSQVERVLCDHGDLKLGARRTAVRELREELGKSELSVNGFRIDLKILKRDLWRKNCKSVLVGSQMDFLSTCRNFEQWKVQALWNAGFRKLKRKLCLLARLTNGMMLHLAIEEASTVLNKSEHAEAFLLKVRELRLASGTVLSLGKRHSSSWRCWSDRSRCCFRPLRRLDTSKHFEVRQMVTRC